MKTVICILFFLSFSCRTTFAQATIGERFTTGISLTYIPNELINNPNEKWEHIWTLNTNLSTYITKKFVLGISGVFIRTYQAGVKEDYKLFGGYLQYDVSRKTAYRFYLESGFFAGDYCTCGLYESYREPNLRYLNYGGGLEWKVRPKVSLEFAFISYYILNNIESKYVFNQYVIGLNYVIGKAYN